MKTAVFWDVARCRSCVNRSFGGTYRLHLQTTATRLRWFLACGFFYPEDGGDTFFRNMGSQKIYTAQRHRKRHSSEEIILLGISSLLNESVSVETLEQGGLWKWR
jgi:hypothetical protein